MTTEDAYGNDRRLTYMYIATTDAGEVDAEPVVAVRTEYLTARHEEIAVDYDAEGRVVGVEFITNHWLVDNHVRVQREGE